MTSSRPAWLLLILMCVAFPVMASETSGEDHHFHQNDIGVFLGGTTPLSNEDGGETALTIGIDYERRFSPTMSAMLMLEHVDDEHKRENILAAMFAYRFSRFRFGIGPGVEFVEKDQQGGGTKESEYFVLVTRLNYEFHVGKFTLSPTGGIDFIGQTKTNLVFGATLGYGF